MTYPVLRELGLLEYPRWKDNDGTIYFHGNGCRWHGDCFSCPFRDCEMESRKQTAWISGDGSGMVMS
jgi:hypothetical protein